MAPSTWCEILSEQPDACDDNLVIIVFFQFGMIASNSGPPPVMRLLVILSILVAATIPRWKMMRWYYRWPVYVVCVAIALALLGVRFA